MPPRRLLARMLLCCTCTVAGAATAALPSPSPPNAAPPPEAIEPDRLPQVSEAELLLRIRQSVGEDLERANVLRMRARHLELEFTAATVAFDALDAVLQAAADADVDAQPAEQGGAEQAVAAAAASRPAALDRRWRLSRDLLDMLLQRRQSIDRQLSLLGTKLELAEQAADAVTSGALPDEVSEATERSAPPEATVPPGVPAGAVEPARDTGTEPVDPAAIEPAEPPPAQAEPLPATPANRLSLVVPASGEPGIEVVPAEQALEVYDSRVARAERELEREQAALRTAERMAQLTEELLALNQDELALVRAGLPLSRRHLALLRRQLAALDPPTPDDAAVPAAATVDDNDRAPSLRRRIERIEQAVHRDLSRVAELESRLDALKMIRLGMQEVLAEREDVHEAARRRLAFVQSPLAPHRLLNWSLRAVPRIAVIIVVLALVWVIGRWLARRIVDAAVNRIRRSSDEERLQRIETLRRALRSAITATLALIAALIVLPEFGVDATVLVGSAAVLSLAVAFGAQSLVKDYFSGFMILSENQYRIGNVVRINDVAGVVEDISLRMSMLRDAEGIAHFIPHSEIRMVSNLTHGWAQAVVDVRVGYREDIDAVMRELDTLAREMQRDDEYGTLILAEPELWGVEALTETAVVVRLVMRTRPLKQWQVKREMLRRIKNRFDELGIDLMVPQQLQFARNGTAPPPR